MKKILVVDNHPVMLKLMTRLLEKEGHRVLTAEDGLSALDTLNTFVPDVIFIDLVMPNITGDKLCRIIRSMPKLKNAFVVILSAIAAEEKVDFIGFGANACIAKGPFDKLSKHIMDVLNSLEQQDSPGFSKEIIGLQEIYKREITKELISSKRHTEIVISNISEGILELTVDARILFANPTGISILGLPEEKLLGSHFVEIFQDASDKSKIRDMLDSVREKTQVISEDAPISINGRQISVTVSSVNDEEYHSMIVILNDITERKQAEKALVESEEKYRSILESIDEGYYELDLSGSLTFFNSSISKIFDYPGDELRGRKIWEFMDEEGSEKEYETLRQVRESGIPIRHAEWVIIQNGGIRKDVEASVSLKADAEGERIGFRGIIHDITDRKRAEQEKKVLESRLRQAKKLESLGTLAGGIAHNFNNLLMGIQGNASLMLLETDPGKPDYERLRTIEKLVQNGSKLTNELLGYAREGKYEVRPLNLNQMAKDTAEIFGVARMGIKIQYDFEDEIFPVIADPGQIEQVLLNLYVNAADAMPEGGTLTLKTRNATHKDMVDRPYTPKEGDYVLLSVSDTGVGMDEKTMERIFEPFYTTKGLVNGTGLGLSSAYGIVKGHGGFIDVHSEKGKGTMFEIFLPASPKTSTQRKGFSGALDRGREVVLLVDDEDIVIEVGKEMLKGLGYTPLIARGGKEAVRVFIENKAEIGMVVLDMVMPDLHGGEVFDRLKKINPNVKVILSSGYSLEGQAQRILDRGCDGFIQKPFNLKQLSLKLRETFEGTRSEMQ